VVAAVKDITKLVDRQMQSVGSRQSKKGCYRRKNICWSGRSDGYDKRTSHGKSRKIDNVTQSASRKVERDQYPLSHLPFYSRKPEWVSCFFTGKRMDILYLFIIL